MAAAPCPVHPSEVVTGACVRCGAFVCGSCTEGGRYDTCEKCRARGVAVELPFSREGFKLFEVFNRSVELFLAHWVTFTVATVVLLVVTVVAYYAPLTVRSLLTGNVTNPAEVIPTTMLASAVATATLGMAFGAGAVAISRFAFQSFRRDPLTVSLEPTLLARGAAAGLLLSVPGVLSFVLYAAVGVDTATGRVDPLQAGLAGFGMVCGGCVYMLLAPVWYFVFAVIARGRTGVLGSFGEVLRMLGQRPGAFLGASFLITAVYLAGMIALCVGLIPATAAVLIYAAALTELLSRDGGEAAVRG